MWGEWICGYKRIEFWKKQKQNKTKQNNGQTLREEKGEKEREGERRREKEREERELLDKAKGFICWGEGWKKMCGVSRHFFSFSFFDWVFFSCSLFAAVVWIRWGVFPHVFCATKNKKNKILRNMKKKKMLFILVCVWTVWHLFDLRWKKERCLHLFKRTGKRSCSKKKKKKKSENLYKICFLFFEVKGVVVMCGCVWTDRHLFDLRWKKERCLHLFTTTKEKKNCLKGGDLQRTTQIRTSDRLLFCFSWILDGGKFWGWGWFVWVFDIILGLEFLLLI